MFTKTRYSNIHLSFTLTATCFQSSDREVAVKRMNPTLNGLFDSYFCTSDWECEVKMSSVLKFAKIMPDIWVFARASPPQISSFFDKNVQLNWWFFRKMNTKLQSNGKTAVWNFHKFCFQFKRLLKQTCNELYWYPESKIYLKRMSITI